MLYSSKVNSNRSHTTDEAYNYRRRDQKARRYQNGTYADIMHSRASESPGLAAVSQPTATSLTYADIMASATPTNKVPDVDSRPPTFIPVSETMPEETTVSSGHVPACNDSIPATVDMESDLVLSPPHSPTTNPIGVLLSPTPSNVSGDSLTNGVSSLKLPSALSSRQPSDASESEGNVESLRESSSRPSVLFVPTERRVNRRYGGWTNLKGDPKKLERLNKPGLGSLESRWAC